MNDDSGHQRHQKPTMSTSKKDAKKRAKKQRRSQQQLAVASLALVRTSAPPALPVQHESGLPITLPQGPPPQPMHEASQACVASFCQDRTVSPRGSSALRLFALAIWFTKTTWESISRGVYAVGEWFCRNIQRLIPVAQLAGRWMVHARKSLADILQAIPASTWELKHADGQAPALCCVVACLIAALVTMSDSVGEFWSAQTYPMVAAIDRQLEPLGVSIGPDISPDAPVSRPMIAVVFGRIMPDDDAEENPSEFADEIDGVTAGRDWNDIIRPAHWTRERSSKRLHSESFEIRH